jgi:hypothetical protein
MSKSIYTPVLCSCVVCKKEYSTKGIYTHFERSHGTVEQQSKYSSGYNGHYNNEEYHSKLRVQARIRNPTHTITSNCIHCNVFFTYEKLVSKKERLYCSLSCSMTHNRCSEKIKTKLLAYWTPEKRKEASNNTKKQWQNPEYASKVLSTSKRFTSKNEVIIRNHFITNYPEHGWTFGGSLRVDGTTITRDLYSPLLKICFEYDGVWHFKDIHGQLQSKQQKDSLLEKWCLDNGYSLIRLDELKYKQDSIQLLEHIFRNITTPIILKIGDRYN